MKNFLQILFFFSLFSIAVFSQNTITRGIVPKKPAAEGLWEIHKPSAVDLKEFSDKNTRITINKTLLGNGNLLLEWIEQIWSVSAWVNIGRKAYTYDGNKNLTETLLQGWDGSVWVTNSKWLYSYDVNNNRIEELKLNLNDTV